MTNKIDFEDCTELLQNPSEDALAGSLTGFLHGDDNISELPEDHYKGMPAFEQEKKKPYKKINVCFNNKQDFEEFRVLMEQPMTEKTKTIWYPAFDREANSLFAWVEDDAE